ncbi:CBS domain-containing protein [Amycolatopsis sp. H20-H5]|uniref:CBS domain-containing protein n=1 Tax=Amycolatopsis sp. H20-H5 TaxID=3046309 RepID=UPI002DB73B78|nr:CBS domain-containing protein [Amycolatopsis sp. H20-H5]MEC3982393.1 CBS domain-containing protein [Amycolatopsis sp. H20-H5]
MRVRDLMSVPVITVTPGTPVKQAASMLADKGFTALPVVDDDECLIGIVTEADLLRDRFPRDARYHNASDPDNSEDATRSPAMSVGEVMTTPVTAMGAGTDVVELVIAMLDSRLRSMPIVDGSRVVGIITRRDLVRVIARDDRTIAADVRHRLAEYGEPGRWTIAVAGGVVEIGDEFDNETDRHVATILAESVPGVTQVHATCLQTQE